MKNDNNALHRWGLIFMLTAVASIFYMFNVWTPMRSDDYWVPFSSVLNAEGKIEFSTNRISDVYEWAQAWYNHRCAFMNGRLSDYVASPILLMGGKPLFNILNTGVFLLVSIAICRFSFRRLNVTVYSVTLALLLLFLPRISGSLFWVCGSCNYLWGALMLLIVLGTLIRLDENRLDFCWKWGGTICALLCGLWHEGLGATLCAGLFWYGAVQILRHRRISPAYVTLTLAAVLGTVIVMTSPAMWVRAGESVDGCLAWGGKIAHSFYYLIFFSSIPLATTALLVWRRPVSFLSPLGGFIIANLGLTLVFGVAGSWGGGYFYLNFALILYILQEGRLFIYRFSRAVTSLACLACVLIVSVALPRAHEINALYEKALREATPNACLVLDITDFGGVVPFPLTMALPEANDRTQISRYFCAWHGMPPFSVRFRSCRLTPESYSAFADCDSSAICVKKIEGKYVLRLPLGVNKTNREFLLKNGKKVVKLLPAGIEKSMLLTQKLRAVIKGWELCYMGKDYHNGYTFLVIPTPTSECDGVVIELEKDKAVTCSLPGDL